MEIVTAHKDIDAFVESLEDSALGKVFRLLALLRSVGHALGLPYARQLGRGLSELRIRDRQEVRIFFAYRDGRAVLLHGFIKKTMRIPSRELDLARKRLAAFDKT